MAYQVTQHAKERAVERLGVEEHVAAIHLTQLLDNSEEIYSQSTTSRSWKHKKKGTIIITDLNKEKIITIYPQGEAPLDFADIIDDDHMQNVIRKEFQKHIKCLMKKHLKLECEISRLHFKIEQIKYKIYTEKDDDKATEMKVEFEQLSSQFKMLSCEKSEQRSKIDKLVDRIGKILGEDLKNYATPFQRFKG